LTQKPTLPIHTPKDFASEFLSTLQDRAFTFPWDIEELSSQLTAKGELPKDVFLRVPKVIFHNAKFDLHVLQRLGFQFNPDSIEDTMMMSHYIDENPPHSLDGLSKEVLNIESGKSRELSFIKKCQRTWVDTNSSLCRQ